jgi:hypothetical protein
MPEVQLYLEAVNAADIATPLQPSIVNASIASAIEGHFGDYHRNPRTSGSKLFINPMMSLLWTFDLASVAPGISIWSDCQIPKPLGKSFSRSRVFVREFGPRPWESIPH